MRVHQTQDTTLILRVNESKIATIGRISWVTFRAGQSSDSASRARGDVGREEIFMIRDAGGPGDFRCVRRPCQRSRSERNVCHRAWTPSINRYHPKLTKRERSNL